MIAPSIFNDVLGPVMPGPSSSHTAGSFHIGRLARSLLGLQPERVLVRFDSAGSYARVFRAQSSDVAFAAGLLGWALSDRRFPRALAEASRRGIQIAFRVGRLERADHPNFVRLDLSAKSGEILAVEAKSTGGGAVGITRVGPWKVELNGKSHVILIEVDGRSVRRLTALLIRDLGPKLRPAWSAADGRSLAVIRSADPLPPPLLRKILVLDGLISFRLAEPVFFIERGTPLFTSAADIIRLSRKKTVTLGELGLAYESRLLALSREAALAEMLARYKVMRLAVDRGLSGKGLRMKLLRPSAGLVLNAERLGRVAVGGIHTRTAARALAAMHVSTSGGTVCAAPTGGSAGVLAAVAATLNMELGLDLEHTAMALFAAAAVGLIVARRATFAAETAGCQVEIGAAGAMAAAAAVDAAGGTALQACDAAAVSFQNTMGSACDLVQGLCEIPCHTRNAVAASSAFVCADLVLGGYRNPIPLDETVDAVLASGRMLPAELRCTVRGGLALAPTARRLGRRTRPPRLRGKKRAASSTAGKR